MPITASCGNCGKTYQAPERLAGKTVRCKQCGEMFRIDAADVEAGEPDLDALERSFSDESLATGGATAMGGSVGGTIGGTIGGTAAGRASVDAHGKSRLERGDAVDGLAVRGEGGSNHLRANFRYRYPGAKQVDQFLPWALVLIGGYVIAQACFTRSASGEEPPSAGVAASRLAILVAAYVFIIWPASHVALTMATTRLRMSTPRAAPWRSFAAFAPVLMLGGGLYVASGGAAVGLILGLLVGATAAVGAAALLFRMFPNEVPTAAGYAIVGSIGGAFAAAAVIFAINLVASSLAKLDKSPTLFVSPIAVGLPWIEPVSSKPVAKGKPLVVVPAPTSRESPLPVAVAPMASALQRLPIPKPDGENIAPLVKLIEVTPVVPGFDEIVTTPVASNALGVIRNAAGGVVEVWDRSTWKQPSAARGRGFDRGQGRLAINTAGRMVWRLVHSPEDRLEQIALGNTTVRPAVRVPAGTGRSIFGFLNDNDLLLRVDEGRTISFERYDVAVGLPVGGRRTFANAVRGKKPSPMLFDSVVNDVRMLPDGKGFVIACRDVSDDAVPSTLALYMWPELSTPAAVRRVPWNDPEGFHPLGLAVTAGAKAALLLNSAGEAYLTVWEFHSEMANADTPPREGAILDRKLDMLSQIAPQQWSPDVDPLLWIDDSTLLLYGNVVIDANNGRRLGTLGLSDVLAQYPAGDGTVLLVQRQSGLNTLLQVTIDKAALAGRRK